MSGARNLQAVLEAIRTRLIAEADASLAAERLECIDRAAISCPFRRLGVDTTVKTSGVFMRIRGL